MDAVSGELGVAVESKFVAVGAVVPYARAGVGAFATQMLANPRWGGVALDLLASGVDPQLVIDKLLALDDASTIAVRQLAIVDAAGCVATHTGAGCTLWAGHVAGDGYVCSGNSLASEDVLTLMARRFEVASGDLADRLVAALAAGQEAGGDKRGQQSAALLVVRDRGGYFGYSDRVHDLRIDDHAEPIKELARLLGVHKAQGV
jgi:uncharacterized Ntn-hydrolase superfamily protein